MRQRLNQLAVSSALILALTAGTARADFEAGVEAYRRGDFAAAAAEWQPLADAGNVDAQHNLGVLYGEGRGVPQDLEKAFELFSRAAENGSADSTFNIARMYMAGLGVERDQAKGLELLRKAADEEHPGALYELGNLYRRGELVGAQDYARAAELYRAAAEGGHLGAVNNLGAMYLFGQGVEKDPAEAGKFFRVAAEAGLPRGLTNLAYLFERGEGTERNLLQAARLYRMAAGAGDVEARERLAALRPELEAAYPAAGSQREVVRHVQLFLTALGLDPGPADGMMGPRTGNAIREFQEKADLPVTGEATPQLRAQLLQVLAPPLPPGQAPAAQPQQTPPPPSGS